MSKLNEPELKASRSLFSKNDYMGNDGGNAGQS